MGSGNNDGPVPDKPLKAGISAEAALAAAHPKAAFAQPTFPKAAAKSKPRKPPQPKAPQQPAAAPTIVDEDRAIGRKSKVPPKPAPPNYFRRRNDDTSAPPAAKRTRVTRRAA